MKKPFRGIIIRVSIIIALTDSSLDSIVFGHIIICGSGTEVEILLCGKTCPPLIYNSSFTITSSPNTVVPSIRTHRPTTLLHPTIHLCLNNFELL